MTQMMRDDLTQSIQRNELTVHYQPKLSLESYQICGAEALVRWQHQKYGWIAPEDFIPLAEESGFIIELGYWVLDMACRDYAHWSAHGHPNLSLAVNFSATQFEHSEFFTRIQSTLKQYQLNPNNLEIELTEGLILTHSQMIERTIQELKSLGIQLAMDDFGTGYSSLTNLLQFPIDTLKIDKSFIRDIDHEVNRVITRHIINLAHDLQKVVVAEGVESAQQMEFLSHHHCDQMQGRYLSMPLASNEFLNFMNQFTAKASSMG